MKKRNLLNVVLLGPLFLLLGMVCAPAASAQDAKVSISVTGQPLSGVLSELERQTDYRFFYNNDLIAGKAPVTVKMTDKPLSSVLKSIL
ncbi:MAG: hypothetical protein J6B62_00115, partial [Bacteroidales bacterium]|nr:hypothetical protein [Bacteroidales bacterium]